MTDFENLLNNYRDQVNKSLQEVLPSEGSLITEAMRYSVLNGGKRLRPILVYLSSDLSNCDQKSRDLSACAVELIHCYSLIHDDLPSMDNDDLRRGKPTCHIKFDEATAILAGDALQPLAFELICGINIKEETKTIILSKLANASGFSGMVGGQLLDLEAEGHMIDESSLENIHQRKTGQLIKAAIMMPSKLANSSENTMENLDKFGSNIGLVFQIMDDLLEAEQNTTTLGKNARSDIRKEKSTYPSLLGISETRNRADKLYENAMDYLESLGENAAGLRWVANYIIERDR